MKPSTLFMLMLWALGLVGMSSAHAQWRVPGNPPGVCGAAQPQCEAEWAHPTYQNRKDQGAVLLPFKVATNGLSGQCIGGRWAGDLVGEPILGLESCVNEETCEQGRPQGSMFRTGLEMGTGRCKGGCQVALADMSYAGGTPWAIGVWGGDPVLEISGQWVETGATCEGQDQPAVPTVATKPTCGPDQVLGAVNGDPVCADAGKTTPAADGQPGTPSGPTASTETPRPDADQTPEDNFDPGQCTNSLAVRDPMGGGTLCVHYDGIAGPPNMVGVSWGDGPTSAGETSPRPWEGGGSGGGGDGGGGEGGDSCGLPDTAPCKIDEEGTPTPNDVMAASQSALTGLDTAGNGHIAALEGMGPGGGGHRGDLALTWLPMIPVGSCQELSITVMGDTYTTDWCDLLGIIRAFLQWGALFLAALYVWRRTTSTLAGSHD